MLPSRVRATLLSQHCYQTLITAFSQTAHDDNVVKVGVLWFRPGRSLSGSSPTSLDATRTSAHLGQCFLKTWVDGGLEECFPAQRTGGLVAGGEPLVL